MKFCCSEALCQIRRVLPLQTMKPMYSYQNNLDLMKGNELLFNYLFIMKIILILFVLVQCIPLMDAASDLPSYQQTQASNAHKIRWVYLILGLIIFSCCMIILAVFAFYEQGRKSPGDIVAMLAFYGLLLSIYFFTLGIYYFIYKTPPLEDGNFCQAFAFIATLSYTGQYICNFNYCFTLRVSITNVLKVNDKFKLIASLICFGLSFVCPIIFLVYKAYGVSSFGMCSIKFTTRSIVWGTIFEFIYILSAIYTVWFFNRNTPHDENTDKFRKKMLFKYILYISASVIMFLSIGITGIASLLAKTTKNQAGLVASEIISDISSTAGPVILCFGRLAHPKIKDKLLGLFGEDFRKRSSTSKKISKQDSDVILLESGIDENETQFQALQRSIRTFQVKTILTGIISYYQNQFHFDTKQIELAEKRANQSVKQVNSNLSRPATLQLDDDFGNSLKHPMILKTRSFEQEISIKDSQSSQDLVSFLNSAGMTSEIMNEECAFEVDQEFEFEHHVTKERKKSKKPKMAALAPQFFNLIMSLDSSEMDAVTSFSPENNIEQIEKLIGPDGGKSGEFFFFTSDQQWIIKTISEQELQAFRMRFPKYLYHMNVNKKSFINKIYGIFSFDMNSMGVKLQNDHSFIHLVLMKNLSGVPKRYILRTYDMKGSEYQREVLKDKSKVQFYICFIVQEMDLSTKTLKDKDFEIIESHIKIEAKYIDEADARLFQELQLMDYSLLVMKVNWGLYKKENGKSINYVNQSTNTLKNLKKSLKVIPSICPNEEGVYYHISIIDYFQEWNLQKIAEQKTKKIITFNPKLDTSAQNPNIYAQRFIENVVEKFFKNES